MRLNRLLAWLAACCLAVCGGWAHAADWWRAESEHFVLTSDADEASIRDYLRRLEALHQLTTMMMGASQEQGVAPRFEVYAMRGLRRLATVRPEYAEGFAGLFINCQDGSIAYAGSLGPGRANSPELSLVILQHEVAHQLMFRHARKGVPEWYVEGFAEFLATTVEEGGKMEVGRPVQGALWSLKGAWLPFEQVLKPVRKGDLASAEERARRSSFYPQSWLLTHYMLSDSDRTQRFNDYFDRLGKGEDAVAAFEPAVGVAVADMNLRLREHMRAFPVLRIGLPARSAPAIRVERLPGGSDEPVLEAAALRTCPSQAHGKTLLNALREQRRQGGESLLLRLALARAELLFGEPAAADALLKAVLAADPENFEAQHLMGRLKAKLATSLEGSAQDDARAEARSHFFKAYRLKKNDAPNLYHLSELLWLQGPSDSLLNAARGARVLSPGVPAYVWNEARVMLAAGDREGAVRALTPLTSNPHAPEMAAKSRDLIESLRAGQDTKVVLETLLKPN
ncbi:hypothetical protein [Ideonella sp.]|uniref:hypothetical protein n=1 Tax=Ideonella sp. TaxID=1929293 RepID=UPI003BB7E7BA